MGCYIRDTFSDITDHELDGFISDIHHALSMCGNRQMTGNFQACGFRIQQHRIRESMRQADPEGTVARRVRTIHHRLLLLDQYTT